MPSAGLYFLTLSVISGEINDAEGDYYSCYAMGHSPLLPDSPSFLRHIYSILLVSKPIGIVDSIVALRRHNHKQSPRRLSLLLAVCCGMEETPGRFPHITAE